MGMTGTDVGAVVAVALVPPPLPTVAVAWTGALVGAAVGAVVEVAGTEVGAAGLVGWTVAAGAQATTSTAIAISEMIILIGLNIFSTSNY